MIDALPAAPAAPTEICVNSGECVALFDIDGGQHGLHWLVNAAAGHPHSLHPAPPGTRQATPKFLLNGRDITDLPPGQRGVMGIGARDPLFDHLTIRDNVAFPIRATGKGKSVAHARASEFIALLGLDSVAEHLPPNMTVGLRLRAALARALAAGADILILDDIFEGLDSETRRDLHLRLRRLRLARGLTMILVTRDRSDALTAAERIAVVGGGTLLQLADATTLFERPNSARVASAMADANILIGMALWVDDDIARIRLASGGEVDALAAPDLREGDITELCVRPGQVAPLFPRGLTIDAGDEDGALTASVQDITNLGDVLRLRFRLNDGTEMIVHRPPGSLPPGVTHGRVAQLAWRAGSAVAFPSTGKQG